MKSFLSKNKQLLGYLLLGLILTVALLHYRFPGDVLKNYLQAKLKETNSSLLVSFDTIKASFPFGLKFIAAEVALKDDPDRVILMAETLLAKPDFWSFLRGRSRYLFRCEAYQGIFTGWLHINKDPANGLVDTQIEIKNVQIGDYTYLSQLIGGNIEGVLDGALSFKGKPDSLMDGAIEADLRLTQGSMNLRGSFLNLESIDLAEVAIKASGNLPTLEVHSAKVKGQQFQGSLSGTIRIEDEFEKSDINLKGTLEPFPDFLKSADRSSLALSFVKDRLDKGRLPFVLIGPLMNLEFSFTRG